MKTFFARQGEVGFFLASGPVPEWPKLEMERGQTILGHSETGHHHVLERPEAATVLVVDPNPPEGLRILRAVMPAAAEVAEASCTPSTTPGWFTATLPFETPDYSARQILRLGTEIQVLAPDALRKAVLKEAKAVVAHASRHAPSGTNDGTRRKRRTVA